MKSPWKLIGSLEASNMLLVVDHASNHVPGEIDLGIDASLLQDHIAWDIGTAAIAEKLVGQHGHAAFLAQFSRLVVDLNRYPNEDGVMPSVSDGIEIPANISPSERARRQRLERFFHPYHDKLSSLIEERQPQFILSIHSFSPRLRSAPDAERPWDVGIMYNGDDRGARFALEYLNTLPMVVGDQLPYSGKDLNATMNRHAETRGIAYSMMEIRQDLLADDAGITRWASIIQAMLVHVRSRLQD